MFEVNEKPEKLDEPNSQTFHNNVNNIYFYAKGTG